MQVIIPAQYDGMLLRAYLLGVLHLSHRLLTRLKARPDGILLNGRPVTVRAVLSAGSCLTLALDDTAPSPLVLRTATVALPDILYEDTDLIVFNKLAHMPTHPSHGHTDDTLANAWAAELLRRGEGPAVFRPINRLDRDTSGAVLVARHALAASRLSAAMQKGSIQKRYLALLEGELPEDEGEITCPIRRAEESIITRCVCPPDAPGAHAARTRYHVLARFVAAGHPRTLVHAEPCTGRTHQLRVHFAHLGAPIVGDTLYGRSLPDAPMPARQALHAHSLTFPHPMTGVECHIRAPFPEGLCALLPPEALATLP